MKGVRMGLSKDQNEKKTSGLSRGSANTLQNLTPLNQKTSALLPK